MSGVGKASTWFSPVLSTWGRGPGARVRLFVLQKATGFFFRTRRLFRSPPCLSRRLRNDSHTRRRPRLFPAAHSWSNPGLGKSGTWRGGPTGPPPRICSVLTPRSVARGDTAVPFRARPRHGLRSGQVSDYRSSGSADGFPWTQNRGRRLSGQDDVTLVNPGNSRLRGGLRTVRGNPTWETRDPPPLLRILSQGGGEQS